MGVKKSLQRSSLRSQKGWKDSDKDHKRKRKEKKKCVQKQNKGSGLL